VKFYNAHNVVFSRAFLTEVRKVSPYIKPVQLILSGFFAYIGVQMGASVADYIEHKKTGLRLINREVKSGCNVSRVTTSDLEV